MNKMKCFKVFAGVLVICIVIILFKAEYASVLLKNATYGIPALINKASVENLYVGSSMFRQGLDIYTLDKYSDDNYILAYNGNQPSSEYYQLKYLLDHNVQIKNLYVDMYVYSAWEKPEISDEKIFLEVDIKEKWNLWKVIKPYSGSPYEMFWRIFVNSNNELLLTWPLMSPILNSQFENGGTLRETSCARYEALFNTSVVEITGNMNSIQKEYLNAIIDLAQVNGINIIFIETPKFENVSNDLEYLMAMREYAIFLCEKEVTYIVSDNTMKYLNDDEGLVYEFEYSNASFFMDTIHLSSEGRKTFSNIIGQYLNLNGDF